jgi:Phage integrase family
VLRTSPSITPRCPCARSGCHSQAAGLESLTPHGIRHSVASLYLGAGTSPNVVGRILGQDSIAATLDLYGHLLPDEMDRWAASLGGITELMCPRPGVSSCDNSVASADWSTSCMR